MANKAERSEKSASPTQKKAGGEGSSKPNWPAIVNAVIAAIATITAAFIAHGSGSPAHAVASPEVMCAQWAIQAEGNKGVSADGILGQQTRSAIEDFQRRHQITADGAIRKQTGAAMAEVNRTHGHPECVDVLPRP